MAADPTVRTLSGDPIVEEARKRFDQCAEWESTFRSRFINDIKFRHGDSDNGFQWPNSIRRARDMDSKPCLTINNIRQHNLQIVNDQKQNKSAIKVMATGNGATKEAADVLSAIVRHIEYQSNAQAAYSTGNEWQVDGGYGAWRLVTGYADNDTFDQEIWIKRVSDPLMIYWDPDCQEKDKRDARFAFVFDDVPRDEFDSAYPEFKNAASIAPLGTGSTGDDWIDEHHVRICEYFRLEPKRDTLYEFPHPVTRERVTLRESRMPKGVKRALEADPLTRKREVWDQVVKWYLIAGEKIIDETEWPGKWIPLICVLGEEATIDGIMDRKGHTRAMKDAQRMFNYNASSQVEFVALQGKTPWVAPAAAIEELESMWNTANTVSHSVLPWKHVDDEGNAIPPPFHAEPPAASMAYQQGMDTAFNQLMMASGQWQNQMGMLGNERTGAAIERRQNQSFTATYHFQDNYEMALRFTGQQILDLIPKIYDTKRVLRLQADDGTDFELEINPAAQQVYAQQMDHLGRVVARVLNPALGKYDVQAGAGPAWATRREQTVDALTLILTQAPALTGIIGDLLLSAMDFDKADEAAARLKRMIPPQALGQGPSPDMLALQQQVQQYQQLLVKALDVNAKDKLKLVGKEQMREIDAYKAETDRFKALADALMLDEGGIKQVIERLVSESLETKLKINGNGGDGDLTPPSPPAEVPPMPGARKAPDGEWYVTDPTRQGKYMRVAPLVQERGTRNIIANA